MSKISTKNILKKIFKGKTKPKVKKKVTKKKIKKIVKTKKIKKVVKKFADKKAKIFKDYYSNNSNLRDIFKDFLLGLKY